MRLKANSAVLTAISFMLLALVLQTEFTVAYKTEIEITPAPPEEQTTKKSGWFSGIKNFFGSGGESTSTTSLPPLAATPLAPRPNTQPLPNAYNPQTPGGSAAQRPPPLAISPAPLMPIGPRPDTPSSSPFGAGNPQQPPQWPQAQHQPHSQSPTPMPTPAAAQRPPALSPQQQQHGTQHQSQQHPQPGLGGNSNLGPSSSNLGRPGAAQPNLPPGFAPYHPPKAQPSGLDLSYGGGASAGTRPGSNARPGFGLAPLTSSTSTTTTTTTTSTTTPRYASAPAPASPTGLDLRGGMFGSSTTTTTRHPSAPKEDFPPLPVPRRPSVGAKEDFPPLPTPRTPGSPTPYSPVHPSSPGLPQPSSPPVWGASSTTPTSSLRPQIPGTGIGGVTTPRQGGFTPPSTPTNGVSFVPHAPGYSTTARTTALGGSSTAENSLATDDEIRTLTEMLFTKEQSVLQLLKVNPQGKTRSIDSGDEAPLPLFEVDPAALELPTVSKLRALFNNYEEDTLTNEHVTPNERREENEFLDAVMSTQVMRSAMLFLQGKGIVTADPKTHRDLVKELWFTQYSRGSGRIGSSGFEHVFVHEVKNGTLIGLHNWVYFADEEKAGNLDYKGYLHKVELGNKAKVLKVRFNHKGVNKPVNGLFVGTTPELELALYTVCFQLRPDRSCHVSLGNTPFNIVTFTWRYRGKHLIGSAYPEI